MLPGKGKGDEGGIRNRKPRGWPRDRHRPRRQTPWRGARPPARRWPMCCHPGAYNARGGEGSATQTARQKHTKHTHKSNHAQTHIKHTPQNTHTKLPTIKKNAFVFPNVRGCRKASWGDHVGRVVLESLKSHSSAVPTHFPQLCGTWMQFESTWPFTGSMIIICLISPEHGCQKGELGDLGNNNSFFGRCRRMRIF